MIDLGVNIDHVATLRNVRGAAYPNVIEAALLAEEAGSDLITLHLREDRRHIRDADVWALKPLLRTRMNLECAVTSEMLDIACQVQPSDVCLVPERRQELTTEGGLDVVGHFSAIQQACQQLAQANIRIALFIDADLTAVKAAAATGATVIELHTGAYAQALADSEQQALELNRLEAATRQAIALGLEVHAGHGLHYENVDRVAAISGITELNIGHAIVARAVFCGWQQAIRDMKALIVQSCVQAGNSFSHGLLPPRG